MKHVDNAIELQDLVDGFLFSLQAEGRASRTHEYYRKLLNQLLIYAREQGWPGKVHLLDTRGIRQFLLWTGSRDIEYTAGKGSRRVSKAKPSTAWPYYKAVRRLFNWAIEEGLLTSSPMDGVRYKSPPPPAIQPYDLEDLRRLLSLCELDIKTGSRFIGMRNKAVLLLFIDSGLRLNEMAHLRLTDLNIEQKWVRVVGKGNKVGICPFSAKTAKVIWLYELERKRRARSQALWITEEGNQLSASGISSVLVSLKRRAGISGQGRVHRLRHTSALQYLRGARDSFLLQLFLRHEDLAMTRRYVQGLKQEEAIQAHRNGASPVERLGLG